MAGNYTAYTNYLHYQSGLQGVPLSGTFELTARCNLDCKMCYIHKRANDAAAKKAELSTAEWLAIAREAQKRGMLFLLLTGGEPLLREDFRDIYTACQKLGLLVSVNTNATLLDEEMRQFFIANPPTRLNITLYGASDETYQRLCGHGGVCGRVYDAVRELNKAGVRVKLNYSATPYTLGDMAEVCRFAEEQKLFLQTASYMFPPLRACELGACGFERLTPEEAAQVRFAYEQYRFDEETLEKRLRAMLAGERVIDPEQECQDGPTERIRCRAGYSSFWLTYHGQMRPCGMMEVPSANVRTLGFGTAWEQTHAAREKIMLPRQCSDCAWKHACEFCPAACYAENGTFERSPDYICRMTDAYMELCRTWREGRTTDEDQ